VKTQKGFRALCSPNALIAGMDVMIDDATNVRRFMEWMDLSKWLFLVFSLVILSEKRVTGNIRV
jgi:hypothetical protein